MGVEGVEGMLAQTAASAGAQHVHEGAPTVAFGKVQGEVGRPPTAAYVTGGALTAAFETGIGEVVLAAGNTPKAACGAVQDELG